MPSVDQLRSRLVKKLSELFQLDQPDLDFGFYRIMHAKSAEVQDFITTDLLKIVADAFGVVDEARKTEVKAKIDKEIAAAKEYGVADPENSPKVKEAEAAYETIKDTASAEADVYDHLYRFFERYYDDGDFISRRYYTRETSGKAAPFAVPYNGEEVKLHWANADQYYIKSAEYFSNFTFDLTQSAEIRKLSKEERILRQIPDTPIKVHFRVVEASEGEHGNVKTSEANKRFFILHAENPVVLTETGELVVNFEYRPDPEKTGQEGAWRDKRNGEAVETILERLENMAAAGGEHEKQVAEYLRLLKVPAPTDSDKKRPVLAKYVNQYTARNTMDYFIHKDLGGFLRRELDFYIKNEVMRLDDIENAEAPAVESYLAKIKVLRKIAGKLIDFLAQLEDFQKKLWLKKKFVVETQYCMTLDRIFFNEQSTIGNEQLSMTNEQKKSPQLNIDHCSLSTEQKWLLEQVVSNKAQWANWQSLGFVELTMNNEQLPEKAILEAEDFVISFNGEKQEGGLFAKELLTYRKINEQLTMNNDHCSLITDHWNLVLDTRFFDDSFKARLVASIENFDEQCDGLLIHSENFQALNLLQERYREQVKCVYIDPPYNTGSDGFAYKDSYIHSSWLSLMFDRIMIAGALMSSDSINLLSIDDIELRHAFLLMSKIYGEDNFIDNIIWKKRYGGGAKEKYLVSLHEYILCYAKAKANLPNMYIPLSGESIDRYYKLKDDNYDKYGAYRTHPLEATKSMGDRPNLIFGIPAPDGTEVFPKRQWLWSKERAFDALNKGFLEFIKTNEGWTVHTKQYLNQENGEQRQGKVFSIIDDVYTQHGTNELLGLFADAQAFSFPKPSALIKKLISFGTDRDSCLLDFFVGSGSSGHAVINLNREDNGNRKYILVEMGDHFDTVLKPRIAKVVYSENWKDGKPTARHTGISHCCKYIRLESYEDTLNNLRLNSVGADLRVRPDSGQTHRSAPTTDTDFIQARGKLLRSNSSLREDYMLRYLLDVETRGSQSLLNIDAFADPCRYTLEVKKPGTDEYATRAVDLIETFNYLIGLRVLHSSVPQTFQATFKRITDPELPEDQHTKLVVDGRIRQDEGGPWWFRKVEGWMPKDAANPNNGQREKVLVVWRKLTNDIEQDNLMLDEWFQKNRISTRDFEFDTIYVNGSNNLPNLKLDEENWKVRLIEEEFMKRMWEAQ